MSTCPVCGRTFSRAGLEGHRSRVAACRASLADRFWEKVDQSGDCWEWTGHLTRPGYGAFWVDGKDRGAHRVSWELALGPVPDGLWVLHRCDNRRCVRPDHLFLGDVLINTRDMDAKGRRIKATGRGVAAANAKLNDDKVRDMRARHAAGETYSSIARLYGVTPSAAQKVIDRKRWAHVA